MSWFFYALLSAISTTAYSLLVRVSLKGRGNAKAFTFLLDLTAAFLMVFLSVFEKKYFNFHFKTFLLFLIMTFLGAITDMLFIRARQLEEVSKLSIVIRLSSVWALLGGFLFFKEPLLPQKIVGVVLTISGAILVLWQGQKISLSKGIRIVILASFLFISNSFIDKYLVGNLASPALYKTMSLIVTCFWVFLMVPNSFGAIKAEFNLQKHLVVLAGIFIGVSSISIIKGIQIGEISRVFPIQSLYVIFSVLGGIFLLKERERIWQKILGAIVAFLGVYFLSI